MTCIVGLVSGRDVWLGGDRAATGGNLGRTIIKHPKIFVKNGVGFGVCGLPKVIDALQHAVDLPTQEDDGPAKTFLVGQLVPALRDGLKKMDCTEDNNGQANFHGAILIAYRGELHELEGNFQLVESAKGFASVGSGSEPALGSLRSSNGNPKKRLIKALEVSAENNAGVAPPFDVLTVKGH